ncbi:MAG: MBL fold metallo-hydrolase [Candidatus Methanoperedens sp.]|nr:MBL fold metallo-hydrolase [Candidatus Methanoperedens sp.]
MNLQEEGIEGTDIDTVILTHGHPDHIGGIINAEGKPAFPNARYVMWKEEWEFWASEPNLNQLKVDEHIKQIILMSARKNLPFTPTGLWTLTIGQESQVPPCILHYTSSPVMRGTFIYIQNVLIRVFKG